MEIAVFFLSIVVIMLLGYIFFMKRELGRVEKSIRHIKDSDSNRLVHSEIAIKELDRLIGEINNVISEAKEAKVDYKNKSEQLKKMITNISHDLRTPLTSALGYIDIMLTSYRMTDLQRQGKNYELKDLKIVKERLERLEELINSFFEFTKDEFVNASITVEDVNVIRVLEESIAHYFDDFNNKNRRIIFNDYPIRLVLKSNREILLRIFDNIIGNAYKHSEYDLHITVKQEEKIRLIFTNKLMYANIDVDHIFDEFYTYDISRQKGNTGLGLAIVKQLVQRLDGVVYAKAEDNNLSIVVEFAD